MKSRVRQLANGKWIAEIKPFWWSKWYPVDTTGLLNDRYSCALGFCEKRAAIAHLNIGLANIGADYQRGHSLDEK